MNEYFHGQKTTPNTWELSPLDLSIYEYEKKCKHYHYRKLKPTNETKEQRKERLATLDQARTELNLEINRIICMISVEAGLQAYRDEFKHLDRKARRKVYATEGHHPPKVLEENLRLAGRAQPSSRFTAHHLVEGKGKLPVTKSARLQLFRHDIRINDPDNGVWMPMAEQDRGHWAMPKAVPHSQIHTHNYERWIYGQIQFLKSEVQIREKLAILRSHLKNGTQPEEVTQSPDTAWNGR